MTIALIHNRYRFGGGEDTAFEAEAGLLESRGHAVARYSISNEDIKGPISAGLDAIWNPTEARRLGAVLRAAHARVAHFHNTFPRISPAGYRAARAEGAAVVQTLHNFRLVCPGATLFRDGHPCEECVGSKVPWRGVVHGCYRGSRLTTAGPVAMLSVHNFLGTWRRDVDAFIAPSRFVRDKLAEGGLPASKIMVKPNFVAVDPGMGLGRGGHVLFAGRLSPEKGADVLVRAWPMVKGTARLRMAGDGPLAQSIGARVAGTGIELLGWQPAEALRELLRGASMIVVPSLFYEICPQIVLEALAAGTPVVASNHGSLPEFIEHGRTGRLFEPGNPASLASEINWLLDHPEELALMRRAAREEYELKYSPAENYRQLMAVYHQAEAVRDAP